MEKKVCNIDRLKQLAEELSNTKLIMNTNNQCSVCPTPEASFPCNCPIYPIIDKIYKLERNLDLVPATQKIKLYEEIIDSIKQMVITREVA